MRQPFEAHTEIRPRMGTLLALTVRDRRGQGLTRDAAAAFAIASRSEQIMSRHDPASQICRLNAAAGQPYSLRIGELAPILRAARRLSRVLEGAFDPTVGPLLHVWQRAARRQRVPSRTRLKAARTLVGPTALYVRGERARLTRRGMALDLGAIGKGLALDRIAKDLVYRRRPSGILNFGESSLLAFGRAPAGGWRVLLRRPGGGFAGEFSLQARACSTSAAFGQSITVAGRRFGHIVDPRSGRLLRRTAQVTVLARSAAVAEAASTALLVLGPQAIPRVARRLQLDVCWIDRAGVHTTRGFRLRRRTESAR
jgi:thiamine biosynthesis lipoprotein